MRTESLHNYITFAVTASVVNFLILLKSAKSNYFFQNYLSISTFFIILLVLFSGIVKAGYSEYFFKKKICIFDYLFTADLVYNIFAITYSSHPRASAEDVFYQLGYFCIYILFRITISVEKQIFERFFTLLNVINIGFSGYILYVVFTKFQLISTDGRISYNSMHPNMLSIFLTLSATISLYFLFKNLICRNGLIFVSVQACVFTFFCFMIIMTSSRAGMLGVFLGITAIAYCYAKTFYGKINFRRVAIGLLAISAVIIIIFPFQLNKLISFVGTKNKIMTLNSRTEIWKSALTLFSNHPLIGVGPGVCNYDIMEITNSSMVDAHNFLLEKLCDVGLVGTLIYLAPLVLIFHRAKKSIVSVSNIEFPEKFALNYSIVFMMIAIFTQASFSPHFALPILSILLYAILGVFVTSENNNDSPAPKNLRETENIGQTIIDLVTEIIIIFIIFVLYYYFFVFLTVIISEPLSSEFALWIEPVSALLSTFTYFFCIHKLVNEKSHTTDPLFLVETDRTCSNKILFPLIFTIITFGYISFNFFVAEKANALSMNSILNFSSKQAIKYSDIAINYDPDNIAYLINRSYLLFLVEHIKTGNLKNNENMKSAIELLKKCTRLFKFDLLVETNLILLNAKVNISATDKLSLANILPMNEYNSSTSSTHTINNHNGLSSNTLDVQLAKQNPNNAFAKYYDIFGEKAIDKFLATNTIVKKRISELITSEAELIPGSELAGFVDYVNMTLRAAVNVDIPGIDKFLMGGVASSFYGLEYANKILPVKDYSSHSHYFVMQQEILASVINILPVIWKFGMNLGRNESAAKFNNLFGGPDLFPIVDYFIFNNDSAETSLLYLDEPLKGYLVSMALFANGKFDEAQKNQESVFQRGKGKGITQINSILLAWIHYKKAEKIKNTFGENKEYKKNIITARELIYYSQMHTSSTTRKDFVYKRDLLYGGSMIGFYYLPIQAYFNEYIMLSLIRLNGGDHKKVLPEIFGFIKNVIYAD